MDAGSWESIETLKDALLRDATTDRDSEPRDREGDFRVVAEDVVDSISSGNTSNLERGITLLRRLYLFFVSQTRDDVELDPAFCLGRICGQLDVAVGAYCRATPEGFEAAIANPRYAPLIDVLVTAELTSSEISARLGWSKEKISRGLDQLEHAGVVVTQRIGRQRLSRLSATARDRVQSTPSAGSRTRTAASFEEMLQRVEDPNRKLSNVVVVTHSVEAPTPAMCKRILDHVGKGVHYYFLLSPDRYEEAAVILAGSGEKLNKLQKNSVNRAVKIESLFGRWDKLPSLAFFMFSDGTYTAFEGARKGCSLRGPFSSMQPGTAETLVSLIWQSLEKARSQNGSRAMQRLARANAC